MILIGSFAIVLFWVLDRLNGQIYDDPLVYRLVASGFCLVVVGLTYVSQYLRLYVRGVTNFFACLLVAFFAWTATKNGLDASWSSGLALVSGSAALGFGFI